MGKKFIYLNGAHWPLSTVRKLILAEDYVALYFKGEKKPAKFRHINLKDFHIGIKEY